MSSLHVLLYNRYARVCVITVNRCANHCNAALIIFHETQPSLSQSKCRTYVIVTLCQLTMDNITVHAFFVSVYLRGERVNMNYTRYQERRLSFRS